MNRRDGQLGALVAIGGRFSVLDWVGRADVFAALHGPLVQGYALDALEVGGRRRGTCRPARTRAGSSTRLAELRRPSVRRSAWVATCALPPTASPAPPCSGTVS